MDFMRKTAAGLLLLAVLYPAAATEIIYDKELPGYGVNTIPLSANTWKSKTMSYPMPITDKDILQTGPEFFQGEYGKSCIFDFDWIKQYGFYGGGTYDIKNGVMEIQGGKNGFYFGLGKHEKYSKDAKGIRFGSAWGQSPGSLLYLDMDSAASPQKETEWEFSAGGISKKFKVSTAGKSRIELAGIWSLISNGDNLPFIMLRCLTPEARVGIKSLALYPAGSTITFKKVFTLKDTPVIAHASYKICEDYQLVINGKSADSGNHLTVGKFLRHTDIKSFLKKGENEIVFTKQFSGPSSATAWLFEGCVADEEGNLTRLLGDNTWQCALNPGKGGTWRSPGVADGMAWTTFTMTTDNRDSNCVAGTGLNPKHMGILDVSPVIRKFPVFDTGEQVVFNAAIPAGLNDKYSVKASVYSHDGLQVLAAENITSAESKITNGLANLTFRFDSKKTGPYLVKWMVSDPQGGKIEEAETEFVIVGPVAQDELELKSFEEEFEKRLELVQKFDCAKDVEIGDEFLGYTGMYNKPAYNPGQVVSKDGMKYRETGTGAFLYYAYRLHLKELGEPYLVEVVVPDNGERQIYTGVAEQYPVWFENNAHGFDDLCTRSPVTGASITGGAYPLSYKPKKIRFVYYPTSLTAAVTVINGVGKDKAAAIEINIYRVRNGLPALKIPESSRLFGSHEERALSAESMSSENVMERGREIRNQPHLYQWRNWYKMTERKIKWLRFQGRNMTTEGAYMYLSGDFPTRKHSQFWGEDDTGNLLWLALKMYRQNRIKCLLSVEYTGSPWINAGGFDDGLSDRKMAEGKKDALFLVDRYGNQITQGMRAGIDFLHPKMREIFLDVFKEVYAHYKDIDGVEGVLMPTGTWFAPDFMNCANKNLENTDVGYGDLTVGLFEKETGIKLGLGENDPTRFSKRYNLLMGQHKKTWLSWREQKLSDCLKQISDTICESKNKWKLYVYPGALVGVAGKDSPFLVVSSATAGERNEYLNRLLRENGLTKALAKKNDRINYICSTVDRHPFQAYRDVNAKTVAFGWNTNPGTLNFIKENAGFYYQFGLDEIDIPATGVKRWIWSRGQRNAYVPRPVGEICMKPFVDIIKTNTPKMIFYAWLDCNMETAHGEQIRRFCKALYETPELEFKALPPADSRGIYAQTATDAKGVNYLRLVNNSPWSVSGKIVFDGAAYDSVYERALEKKDKGFLLNLLPADIRIIKLTGGNGPVKCDFAFEDSVRSELTGKAQAVLASKVLAEKISRSYLDQLAGAVKNNDAFLIYTILEDFEVKRCLEKYSFQSLESQGKLLADLKKNGKCFINCAAIEEYIDPSGNRWLPDQGYNGLAYGNEYAQFADRGDLPIEGTEAVRVYQTEAGGQQVYYHIPLPDGVYDIYIHSAQTWQAGMAVAKPYSVTINAVVRANICPAKAGFAKAVVDKIGGVVVKDGLLSIQLKGDVVINGIEIRKI